MKCASATTAVISALIVLCGCQSSHSRTPIFSAYESPYPNGSAVAIAPALELPAVRKLKETLTAEYGNDSFEIVARRPAGPLNQLIIDSKGRLWKGDINEVWTVDVFGKEIEYDFLMRPDGKGTTYVEFKKR